MIISTQIGQRDGAAPDQDEVLSTRLRDLALVDLDALTVGLDGAAAQQLTRPLPTMSPTRCARRGPASRCSRRHSAGPDPLNVLDLQARQRASDAGHAGAIATR